MNTDEETNHKLKVLKNALIQERQSNQNYEKEIASLKLHKKELEILIVDKENRIIQTIQDKNNLLSQYNIYKQHANKTYNEQELCEEFAIKAKEIYDLKAKIDKLQESQNSIKKEYQSLITSQLEKISFLEKDILTKRKELENYLKLNIEASEKNKRNEVINIDLTNRIKNKDSELKECHDSINLIVNSIQDKERYICSLKENLRRHEFDNSQLAKKLTELKNAIISENLKSRTFKGKILTKFIDSQFELTFGKTEENIYVAVFKEEDKDKDEIIPIEDIEFFRIDENNKYQAEFGYLKNSKLKKFSLVFNENPIPAIKLYKEFLSKSVNRELGN